MNRILIFCLISTLFLGCQTKKSDWDEDKLDEVIQYAQEIGTFSLIIQTDEEIIASYGDIDKVSRVHSIRKAILSALVFQHLDTIDLNATLDKLNIQDTPIPLTDLQRMTKVIHLLKSTSGINHPTGSQIGAMQEDRDRLLGTIPNIPGTKWAYNNWDYNVLTTIFEQETGLTISNAFERGIAKPLDIHDFQVIYRSDSTRSLHQKAGFRLSTRDMAKFGQLFLSEGKWENQQLIPKKWIKKITSDYTLTVDQGNERYGHGYLWWIHDQNYAKGALPEGSYVSTGAWGQRILVIPEWNTVIAHKTMTEIPAKQRTKVTRKEFEQLVYLISQARK